MGSEKLAPRRLNSAAHSVVVSTILPPRLSLVRQIREASIFLRETYSAERILLPREEMDHLGVFAERSLVLHTSRNGDVARAADTPCRLNTPVQYVPRTALS